MIAIAAALIKFPSYFDLILISKSNKHFTFLYLFIDKYKSKFYLNLRRKMNVVFHKYYQ